MSCTTAAHSRILTGEGIAYVRKYHHSYLNQSHNGAELSISHLQRIPWAAA
jgi:hypothetical protein